MTSLLGKHAPLQKKTITVRSRVPWFNNEIKEASVFVDGMKEYGEGQGSSQTE